MSDLKEKYLKTLRERRGQSKVYKKHQLIGLEVSQILGDEKHKALYMKLAKEKNPEELLRLAKEIAERTDIKKKGAYFMACLDSQKSNAKPQQ